uniref:Uncharacterized protein n=1 Tax=viral metagenome TaxID=1070528 RepID=A0A6C0F480_9ZZZZ
MPLYVFTVRRAKIDGDDKYIGMIPKLVDEMYQSDDSGMLDIYKEMIEDGHSKKDLFDGILSWPNNCLNRSKYINKQDIPKIIKLNEEFYLRDNFEEDDDKLIRLIEHLFRAHSTMEYGIYFGSLKADNDEDFLKNIVNPSKLKDRTYRIVHYTQLDNLLDYVDRIKKVHGMVSNLLYFNEGWQYGEKEETSMDYNGENREEFKKYLEKYDNEKLSTSEILVQCPIEPHIFNFTYRQHGGSKSKKKKKKKKN